MISGVLRLKSSVQRSYGRSGCGWCSRCLSTSTLKLMITDWSCLSNISMSSGMSCLAGFGLDRSALGSEFAGFACRFGSEGECEQQACEDPDQESDLHLMDSAETNRSRWQGRSPRDGSGTGVLPGSGGTLGLSLGDRRLNGCLDSMAGQHSDYVVCEMRFRVLEFDSVSLSGSAILG